MLQWRYSALPTAKMAALNRPKRGAWLSVENPTREEVDYLVKNLHIEKGLLLDALDPEEVPRSEFDSGSLYLFLRIPQYINGTLDTFPFLCIITPKYCCTISHDKLRFLIPSLNETALVTKNPTLFVLQLLFLIAETYEKAITQQNKELFSLRRSIERITPKQILRFITSEEQMNDLLNSLMRILLALQSVSTHKKIQISAEEKEVLQDVILEFEQQVVSAKNNLRSTKNTHDAYTAIMTNNLNRVIKLFTSLTVILTIPTIVASFFGMNVTLPLQNHPYAFVVIVITTVTVVGWLLYLFNRNDWL